MRGYQLPPHLDALFISDARNIFYLTGFAGVSAAEREAFLLITKTTWYLFTFLLYKEEADRIAGLTPIFLSHHNPLRQAITQPLRTHNIQTLGVEAYSLTLQEFDRLNHHIFPTRMIQGGGWIEGKRKIKDEQEQQTLQQAVTITDDCFASVTKNLKLGVTEKQLAWEIEKYFKERGADISFPPIVAFNEHSAFPHHVPDGTKLTENSLVLLDFGATVGGYHADMTRVVFVGKPLPEWVKAYETVHRAQQAAIEYLQKTPDPSGAAADKTARAIIEAAGYPSYSHGLGHGVGLEIHEAPHLSMNKDEMLKPGMIFSVEPGIYLPGKFGIRIEDLVVLKSNGLAILSHAPFFSL